MVLDVLADEDPVLVDMHVVVVVDRVDLLEPDHSGRRGPQDFVRRLPGRVYNAWHCSSLPILLQVNRY